MDEDAAGLVSVAALVNLLKTSSLDNTIAILIPS